MSWKVRRTPAGLWEVIAPSGQVAGLCCTRGEAVETVQHLGRVQGLAAHGVAAVEVPTMSETMRARLAYARRERSRRERSRREWARREWARRDYTGQVSAEARRRDPALDRWLNARKRRNAA